MHDRPFVNHRVPAPLTIENNRDARTWIQYMTSKSPSEKIGRTIPEHLLPVTTIAVVDMFPGLKMRGIG